jgi:hypothetical protein
MGALQFGRDTGGGSLAFLRDGWELDLRARAPVD